MIEDSPSYDLTDHQIRRSFQGILHMPHSIIYNNSKQNIYDGLGTRTAISLDSKNSITYVYGNTNVYGSLSANKFVINSNFTILGDISSSNKINVNDVIISPFKSSVHIRALSGLETSKLRILQETNENFELIFGDPNDVVINNRKLFTIKVNNNYSNNLYIKNDYNIDDLFSPLWIDRATGEVHILNLIVTNIKNISDPTKPVPPTVGPRTVDTYRNVVPIGTVAMFASLGIPDGWIECNGKPYDISLFPELFGIIGFNYTSDTLSNNFTRFCVPDLRGLFVRSYDHGRDNPLDPDAADRDIGSYQVDAFKAHKHYLDGISSNYAKATSQFIAPGLLGIIITNPWTPHNMLLFGYPPCPPGTPVLMASLNLNGIGALHTIKQGSGGQTLYEPSQNDPSGLETRPKNISLVYAIKW